MLKNSEEVTFVFSSKMQKLTLYAPYLKKEGYNVASMFKYDNYISMGASHFIKKKFGKKTRRKYNPKLVNQKGLLLVFDSMIDLYDLNWLKKNNPDARCVFVIWNPIELIDLDLKKIKKIGYDIWSYDKDQCEKYHVKHSPSFFCKSMYPLDELDKIEIVHDACYVGKDKGRLRKINEIIDSNKWNKINWNLYVTPDHFWQRLKNKNYKKSISYLEVQRIQSASKAILEMVPSQSVNITMRAIDAMVLNRKLITDSKNVVNMDYYNENNVFVIGKDDSGDLEDFLNSPYVPIDNAIVEKYDIKNWVNRIINDEPLDN